MDPNAQLNDALLLLGVKELEIQYLRRQVTQLQALIKQAAEAKPEVPAIE